jgi:hypothetical protein
MLEYLKLFGEWIKSVRTMSIAGTVAALALFLPAKWLEAIHMTPALDGAKPWLWLVFAVCISGIVYDSGNMVVIRERHKRRLRNLAFDEQDIMKRFVQRNGVTHDFHESDVPITNLLVRDKILSVGSPEMTGRNMYHFSTEPWILEYLKTNRRFVGLPKV